MMKIFTATDAVADVASMTPATTSFPVSLSTLSRGSAWGAMSADTLGFIANDASALVAATPVYVGDDRRTHRFIDSANSFRAFSSATRPNQTVDIRSVRLDSSPG